MRLLVDILNNKNLKINKLHKPNRNKGGINEKKTQQYSAEDIIKITKLSQTLIIKRTFQTSRKIRSEPKKERNNKFRSIREKIH